VGKSERERPVGISENRWADDIKMDFKRDEKLLTGYIWLRI
jgi:hypothetical protein